MNGSKLDILKDLTWRGLVQDVSDAEILANLTGNDAFYVGYDPTASSLQIGNFVAIKVSIHLAKAGMRALQLFGGATGAIGDPSGKNTERLLLTRETIEANIANHSRIVGDIFARAGAKAEFVNNYDWFKGMPTIEFLRDVGKHFTVNYMIAKEVVKARLEGEGISYTEFSYMLLQAYDFYHLFTERGCRLQIGGSDQWGNITSGLEFIRKKLQGSAAALSFPLILDSTGQKFGKTSSGSRLWLDARETSPYKMHQYWLNTKDADVVRYLKIFTFLDEATIMGLDESVRTAPEKREAQKRLADEVCSLLHGESATAEARKSAEVLFGGSIEGLTEVQLLDIFSDVPSSTISREQAGQITAVELFAESGLAKSKGEARRLFTSGGAYINNERISDVDSRLEKRNQGSNLLILRSGKKNYHLVKIA